MNLASVWKLPVIFCCENNQYAESTSVEYSLSTAHVADRAAGYDMPGVHVDGMDVFAVYDAAGEAVARAKAGEGPTLLECLTYRYYGHTVFDNPLTYRTKEEEEHWRGRDPIKLFRDAVIPQGEITAEELDQIDNRRKTRWKRPSSSPMKARVQTPLSCTMTCTAAIHRKPQPGTNMEI